MILRGFRRHFVHPPATILTISNRSPAFNRRLENSEGATASPLCSTTTLRGSSFWATKNSSIEQGRVVSTGLPLAVTWLTPDNIRTSVAVGKTGLNQGETAR